MVCCKHAVWQSRVSSLSALEYMQGIEVISFLAGARLTADEELGTLQAFASYFAERSMQKQQDVDKLNVEVGTVEVRLILVASAACSASKHRVLAQAACPACLRCPQLPKMDSLLSHTCTASQPASCSVLE